MVGTSRSPCRVIDLTKESLFEHGDLFLTNESSRRWNETSRTKFPLTGRSKTLVDDALHLSFKPSEPQPALPEPVFELNLQM